MSNSTANTGTYQRRCKRCERTDAITVRVEAAGEDWIVAVVECGHCGVEADTVIGERGDRMRALLYARPRSKETAKEECVVGPPRSRVEQSTGWRGVGAGVGEGHAV